MIFPRNLFYQISHHAWQAVDLLFPPACAGCGQTGVRFCTACVAKNARYTRGRVDSAIDPGEPSDRVIRESQSPYRVAGSSRPGIDLWKDFHSSIQVEWLDHVYAWGLHVDPLRKAVLSLKYRGNLALGDALCQLLLPLVAEIGLEADVVMPVPLSQKRKRKRGYNQAALLAGPLAYGMGCEYHPGAIRRVRETESQVGKSLRQRQENVSGAFEARHSRVSGKRVLLVDDVLTTGSTLDAAAAALKQAGAVEVSAVVISRAP